MRFHRNVTYDARERHLYAILHSALVRFPGGRNCLLLLSLSDGLNSAPSPAASFRVRVRDVRIHLDRNDPLDVFPMTRAPVTGANLLVTASDGGENAREIAYVVKRPPQHGRLVVVGDRGKQVRG